MGQLPPPGTALYFNDNLWVCLGKPIFLKYKCPNLFFIRMADELRINNYTPVCVAVSARRGGHTESDDQSEHADAGHFAERHFAERYFAQRLFSERLFAESHFVELFSERTICQTDYLQKGHSVDRTL